MPVGVAGCMHCFGLSGGIYLLCLSSDHGEADAWLMRAVLLSLCSQVLLLPPSVPPTPEPAHEAFPKAVKLGGCAPATTVTQGHRGKHQRSPRKICCAAACCDMLEAVGVGYHIFSKATKVAKPRTKYIGLQALTPCKHVVDDVSGACCWGTLTIIVGGCCGCCACSCCAGPGCSSALRACVSGWQTKEPSGCFLLFPKTWSFKMAPVVDSQTAHNVQYSFPF